ncbi:MAG: hypothetical protein LAP87_13435 [Acidobacteriia bacterium]|nr:hypothetical protein [Terriglobia bacterium]
MLPAEATERLAAARSELGRACDMLVSPSPEMLDRCSAVLAQVAGELAGTADWLPQARANPLALAEACRVRGAVMRARKLLQNASDYHLHWTQILGAMSAGYTAQGAAAPVVHRSRVCLRG